MRQYLLELAEIKAREIMNGLGQIKNTLLKPHQTLIAYVDFVNSVKMCKN
jgi:hypothetical protein